MKNRGLDIFKRLQGGTEDLDYHGAVALLPGELAQRYAAALALAENQRAEAMHEKGDYGNSPDVIYPEELELKRRADQLKAERALELAMGENSHARGTANVQHLAGGTTEIPAPAGIGDIPKPPNLPYIQGGGLFGSNYWPAWVRYGLGAIPYAGQAFNAARTGYNIFDRIRWAMTQPRTGGDTSADPPADDSTGQGPAPAGDTRTPTPGIGIDPMGDPADPGEYWSNDFGRWGEGDQYGTTPGNYVNRAGPGGAFGSRGVWGGQTTIPGGNAQNFMPSLGWAMPAASGGGAYGGNTMAKIAMHGKFRDVATPEQWNFMQNYLGGGGGKGGSGQGVGGAGRPMTQTQQMGTSSVNPGLKLFHAQQKRKKQ